MLEGCLGKLSSRLCLPGPLSGQDLDVQLPGLTGLSGLLAREEVSGERSCVRAGSGALIGHYMSHHGCYGRVKRMWALESYLLPAAFLIGRAN